MSKPCVHRNLIESTSTWKSSEQSVYKLKVRFSTCTQRCSVVLSDFILKHDKPSERMLYLDAESTMLLYRSSIDLWYFIFFKLTYITLLKINKCTGNWCSFCFPIRSFQCLCPRTSSLLFVSLNPRTRFLCSLCSNQLWASYSGSPFLSD